LGAGYGRRNMIIREKTTKDVACGFVRGLWRWGGFFFFSAFCFFFLLLVTAAGEKPLGEGRKRAAKTGCNTGRESGAAKWWVGDAGGDADVSGKNCGATHVSCNLREVVCRPDAVEGRRSVSVRMG